jgi:low temperature requirement protein LtrA
MALRLGIQSDQEQGAGFVELFFDLAFVFAVTEVTALTAEHLELGGLGRSLLVFWLIWWGWTQWTWALNAADTEHGLVRLGTLVATGIAFLMAASVDQAFGSQPYWFVLPYLAIRLLGLGIYYLAALESHEHRAAVKLFSLLSFLGLGAVLAGAFVDPPLRNWFWLAAIMLDLLASGVAGRRSGWDLKAAHFAERHGLFVIIALGESLIVAGAGIAEPERSAELVLAAIAAVAVGCLLWWTYFGWLKDALEERLEAAQGVARTTLGRDAYSFIHFIVIVGIVGFAAAVEDVMAHPTESLPDEFVTALGVGVCLFVGGMALAYWRASQQILFTRLLILAAGMVALALVSSAKPPVVFGVLIITLFAIALAEHFQRSQVEPAAG